MQRLIFTFTLQNTAADGIAAICAFLFVGSYMLSIGEAARLAQVVSNSRNKDAIDSVPGLANVSKQLQELILQDKLPNVMSLVFFLSP